MNKKFDLQHTFITLDALFESMPVAMALIDRNGRDVVVNQKLNILYGYNPNDLSYLSGRKVADFCKISAANIERDFRMFDEGLEVPDHEIQIKDKICHVSVKPIRDSTGFTVGEMVCLTDITQQKSIEKKLIETNEQLQFLANNDPLTGLLNSRTYYAICDKMITISHRNNALFSVLFVDLDHFKNINDTYGHDAGDLVLKATSNCIMDSCRKSDVIGRVGGEEFAIFLPETDNTGAINFAEKLRANIELLNPSISENKKISITASIGVASKMPHHKAIADIQRDADHAMYHAKKNGRNRVACLYHPCYVEQNQAEPVTNDPHARIKILNIDFQKLKDKKKEKG
jgi:diguanylate cyclase (GGDEF)-like protein/PAS domain S-box-containing protein